jgi:1-deoxy-D-xylulose-5-phosphate reductoisomerase
MKNILLLGATGSIGDSVLSVIKQNKQLLNLFGIALNSNISKATAIIDNHNPSYVYLDSKASFSDFQNSSIDDTRVKILHEKVELEELINHKDVDIIVSAISGFAGLKTTIMAAKSGKVILLANKESVVVA